MKENKCVKNIYLLYTSLQLWLADKDSWRTFEFFFKSINACNVEEMHDKWLQECVSLCADRLHAWLSSKASRSLELFVIAVDTTINL